MLNVFARVPSPASPSRSAAGWSGPASPPTSVTVTGTVGAVAAAVWFLPPRPAVPGAPSSSPSSCCSTCSTARWPGPAAAARCSAPCSTPPATGPPTARSSARWSGGSPASGDNRLLVVLALLCLVAGVLTSYIKARAEGVGLARRRRARRAHRAADPRCWSAPGSTGLGVPVRAARGAVGAGRGSAVTVGQRIVAGRTGGAQARGRPRADRPARGRRAGPVTGPRRACAPAADRAARPTPGFAAGWRRRCALLPEPVRRAAAFDRRRPLAAAPRRARACASCGPTSGSSRRAAPGRARRALRAGLRSYARYWQEAFRLPRDGPAAGPSPDGRRASRGRAVRRRAATPAAAW